MQVEFEHIGNEDHGTFGLNYDNKRYFGTWVADRFEDSFEYACESTVPEGDSEEGKWLMDSFGCFAELIKCPYDWTRMVFQEQGFIVELTDNDVVNCWTVGAWTMLGQQDHQPRFTSSYNFVTDAVRGHTAVANCIMWVQEEFAGNEHVELEEIPDEDEDPLMIIPDSKVHMAAYAEIIGTEFREATEAVRIVFKRYMKIRGILDHLYWTCGVMHERELLGNDDHDSISNSLYVRDEDYLIIKDRTSKYQ